MAEGLLLHSSHIFGRKGGEDIPSALRRALTKDITDMTATTDSLTLYYRDAPLRAVVKDSKLWFVASDLCRILDIYVRRGKVFVDKAVRTLRADEKQLHEMETSSGPRLVRIISESALRALASRPKVVGRVSRDWLINEALPTIHRTCAALRP